MLMLKSNKTTVIQENDLMFINGVPYELDNKNLFTLLADIVQDEYTTYIDEELAFTLVQGGDLTNYDIERINRTEFIYHSTLEEPLKPINVLEINKEGTWVLN